jgi:cytochrome b6-f complex iron-sulfur subunit
VEKDKNQKTDSGKMTRRYFFESLGFGAVGLAAVGSVLLTGEYLSPNVVREPPTKFKAGKPDDFQPGSVTLDVQQKVFIVRAKEGFFYAISAVCTHLGCITNWKPDQGIIACPCHGSKFNTDGTKIAGPAPRPLPRFSMVLDDQGTLVVDKSVIVSDETTLKI